MNILRSTREAYAVTTVVASLELLNDGGQAPSYPSSMAVESNGRSLAAFSRFNGTGFEVIAGLAAAFDSRGRSPRMRRAFLFLRQFRFDRA